MYIIIGVIGLFVIIAQAVYVRRSFKKDKDFLLKRKHEKDGRSYDDYSCHYKENQDFVLQLPMQCAWVNYSFLSRDEYTEEYFHIIGKAVLNWHTVKDLYQVKPERWFLAAPKNYARNDHTYEARDMVLTYWGDKGMVVIDFQYSDWIEFMQALVDFSNAEKEKTQQKAEYEKQKKEAEILASVLNTCQKDINELKALSEKEINIAKNVSERVKQNLNN